jgi:DNA-binding NarL/FixJ family response regulator
VQLLVGGDDPIVRKGFHEIVRSRPGWIVSAEAGKPAELFEMLQREDFDVVILDVPFGESSGVDLVERIRSEWGSTPMIVVSAYPESHYAMTFLRAGVNAFLPRSSDPAEILDAIAAVAQGNRYITTALATEMARDVDRGSAKQPHERLSAREFEVFRLLAVGRTPTEIAALLHLSVKTVSTYRARILEKTGFRSNADIVGYAIRNRLV